jgi:hypothetical protein
MVDIKVPKALTLKIKNSRLTPEKINCEEYLFLNTEKLNKQKTTKETVYTFDI